MHGPLPLTYLCCCSAFALRMLHFIWFGGIGLVAGCEGGNLSWLLMNVFTSLCGRCVCCVCAADCWSRPFNRACAISDASTTTHTKSHVQSLNKTFKIKILSFQTENVCTFMQSLICRLLIYVSGPWATRFSRGNKDAYL